MNNNKINLITSMTIILGTDIANHLKKSIIICPCQVSGVDQLDENNIKEISDEKVYNWKRIISKSGELLQIKVDIADTGYGMDDNNPVRMLEPICRKMAMGKKPFTLIEKAQIEDNPQACILCDIIEIRLSLNYL